MPPAPQCLYSKRSGPNNESLTFAVVFWTFWENKNVAPAVEPNGGQGADIFKKAGPGWELGWQVVCLHQLVCMHPMAADSE